MTNRILQYFKFRFGFVGLILVVLAIANFFAGAVYLLRAREGAPLDIAVFFGFVLLGPFVLAILAGAINHLANLFRR